MKLKDDFCDGLLFVTALSLLLYVLVYIMVHAFGAGQV